MKCKTPDIPQEARMDEGDTAEDDVEDGVEEEEVNADEEDGKATRNEGSGSARTAGKGRTSAQVARKLCAVQWVENNRNKKPGGFMQSLLSKNRTSRLVLSVARLCEISLDRLA